MGLRLLIQEYDYKWLASSELDDKGKAPLESAAPVLIFQYVIVMFSKAFPLRFSPGWWQQYEVFGMQASFELICCLRILRNKGL